MGNIIEILSIQGGLEWGPAIPQYFFFTGISAAAFLISSLTYVFGREHFRPIAGLALILAFTVLLAAPLNLVADLAQPGRFYSLFYRIHLTSPMSWGVFLLTFYPLLIAVEGLFGFRAGFARRGQHSRGWRLTLYKWLSLGQLQVTPQTETRDHRVSKVLGIVGIPTAIAVHGYTGFILYFAVGRPLWATPLMPVIFLVSAVVSGLALMILLTWLMVPNADGKPRWSLMDRLGILLGWTIIVDLSLRILWHGLSYLSDPVAYRPVLAFLFGEQFVESVIIELGLALILPAFVMLVPAVRRIRLLFLISAFLTTVGVWLFRWSTVIGGQEIPKVAAGFNDFAISWFGGKGLLQVIGNWGIWLFLFILFTSFLPWRIDEVGGVKPARDTHVDEVTVGLGGGR